MDFNKTLNLNGVMFLEQNNNVAIIGCGFVGGAMIESLKMKGVVTIAYDKFKDGGIGTFDDVLKSNMAFLCLPTPYDSSLSQYDKSAIYEVCQQLKDANYNGLVIIKSTIEVGTMEYLVNKYALKFIHNPEFLTARTALYDFHNQQHIVLGSSDLVTSEDIDIIKSFFIKYYNAPISICTIHESEAMKLFCNSFYACKVQIFNEMYLLCEDMDISYNNVKDLMIKNGWINPMHTLVPGTDGRLSFSGACLPKDLNALNQLMQRRGTRNMVVDAAIKERNMMRDDNINNK